MKFDQKIHQLAAETLDMCRKKNLTIATAESCTGGMIAAALTEIAGSSDVFDRGFVTYSNNAKFEMLGVPLKYTDGLPGAVSELVAGKMAEGALRSSGANIAVAVTGIAGPGGGSMEKPVGLVFVACSENRRPAKIKECRFGNIGRLAIRQQTTITALEMLKALVIDGV